MRKAFVKRVMVLILALCLVFVPSVTTVYALYSEGQSYVLDGKTVIPIPKPYIPARYISNIGGEIPFLSNPQDFYITKKGDMYVCDTDNDRVVLLNTKGKLVKEFKEANGIGYYKPSGVFVDRYDHVFIADTGNARIVHLNNKGEYVEEFIKPESDMLFETSGFEPNKVAIGENTGYVYVLQGKHFMTIDSRNQFKGYIGVNKVGFDLRNFLYRMFASDDQKKQAGKKEPSPYNNFHATDDGLLYAVASGNQDQLRIINSVGNNIYSPGFYGEMAYDESGKALYPHFSDIAVDNKGIITVAEQQSSKLYQYDNEGNLLAVFGGKGTSAGQFDVISGIFIDAQNRLYVLDSSRNNIQVLEPTRMIQTVQQANELYLNGRYSESQEKWEEVMSITSNYPLARKSIGKIQYKEKRFKESMKNFYSANDKNGYGMAFEQRRYAVLRSYFGWLVAGAAIIITAVVWILLYFRRKAQRYENDLYDI